MIALLDTSQSLEKCSKELGSEVEQLVTPLTRFKDQQPGKKKSMDNGGFSGFDETAFLSLLVRERKNQELYRWVAVPDIVASARRTLEAFEGWKYRPELHGWRLALVAQDGLEDLPIPWSEIDAIFIGGSTQWKMSKHAADIIKTGIILRKWVHVGRVNTPGRFEYFEELGADSIDGTGLSRYSWMRKEIYERHQKPKLFD